MSEMAAVVHAMRMTRGGLLLSPQVARSLFLLLITAFVAAVLLLNDSGASRQAISTAGGDLMRLLRLMAILKATMAVGVTAAVFWRLGTIVTPMRLVAYILSCGATAAGPLLIWNMAHVVAGALLLHGGLLVTVVLMWRDPRSRACSQRWLPNDLLVLPR